MKHERRDSSVRGFGWGMRGLAPQRWLALATAGTLLVAAAALFLRLGAFLQLDVINISVAGIAAAAAGVLTHLLHRNQRRLRVQDSKVSEDLEDFAKRLLSLEARVAMLDGSGLRADSTLTDMAGDMHSLSEVVRSLAETMTGQEREISQLRQRAERSLSFQAMALAEPSGPGLLRAACPEPDAIPSFLLGGQFLANASPREPAAKPPASDESEVIQAAIAAGRIDLHVNPILGLPQRRERFYDLYPLLRLSDESLLMPEEFGPVLDRNGGRACFDAAILEKATELADGLAAAGSDVGVIVTLSAPSDPGLLETLEAILESSGALLNRLVLQVDQRSWNDAVDATGVFARLLEAGTSFALDDVRDENLNPAALARQGVRLVRLRADRLIADEARPDVAALVLALSRAGIDVVADAIDNEAVVPELLDLGIPLAQGLGLALPFPVEAAVGAAAASTVPSWLARAEDEPAASPEPELDGPLRKFLRRAG